ncbi:MAG: amino acid adenylation domain-containing protein, partial [Acidobacteria bacterium]|nr:amino acid adenylation domain-containing protein [Acidobacteriota bacterium]
LQIQYADYAVWQRKVLEGESLERLMGYWRRQLQGATTILEIPGDYERPAKQTFNGDYHLFELSEETTEAVRRLTEEAEGTLFMTLLAAFSVLLYRLTGQKDVLVGTPIAGRKGAEVESLIGLFVNTLVLRAQMEPEMSFLDLLAAVRRTTLEAYEYQDVPFEKLVLELNPKRDLSHSPLVQVLFSLQNIPTLEEVLTAGGESSSPPSQSLSGHTGTAKFDFAMFVSEVGDRLQVSVEFNTDLFSMATIEAICGYFRTLLEGITRDPHASLLSYPLMDAQERQRCLERSRGRVTPFSATKGCHELFEEQCRKTPQAPALTFEEGGSSKQVTYGELNIRANRLARFLRGRGVRSGDKVALCLPRGPQQIVSVLGIVKAGAAYVPLDPDSPPERLRFIVENVAAPLVLISEGTRVHFDEGTPLLVLEEVEEEVRRESADDLEWELSPEAPLYVIHTSGSTGRPKGVVMPHRSIVNLVEWQARASVHDPSDPSAAVTLQFAALTFDVASQEIFSTLTSGGCLQLVDESVRRESPRLLELLKRRGVNRLFLPPVALEQLALAAVSREVALDALREVIVAGDRLQVSDAVRELFEKLPRARLVNQYGPTESHVVSAHVLEGTVSRWPAHPPIGRPIDNVQLHVLDERREPVPTGVAGELYIGGVAVASGYLNLPKESKERFLSDPFSEGEGELYRTGDVCRYDSQGSLVFLGRADQQIKLRGFRIEPGEVEVNLKGHPGVEDAVVVKRPSKQGEDLLVAYLVMEAGSSLDKAAVRAHLSDRLPAYMIPTHLVPVESFPLTSSGKVDRRRLPEPPEEELARERERRYVAPRTPTEQFLAECWSELLQAAKVGIQENFFELGGHSLSATQLVSRIRDRYGLELPLFRIFERPTVELLGREIVQMLAADEEEAELEALLAELEALSEEDSAALLAGGAD